MDAGVSRAVPLSTADWATENFGTCELGDARRTRRAVKVAQQMAEHPSGATPEQIEVWGDLKAAYRLFDRDAVTFTALAEPHWRHTLSKAQGIQLLLGDTTETDYGHHRDVPGLGPTGDGRGLGFLLHSSLMVAAGDREVLGMAAQELFYRKPRPRNENSYRATQRKRESEVWGRVIDRVGTPPPGGKFIHVLDRGADNLEVFCHAAQQHSDWVIRAAQLHRTVEVAEEQLSLEAALARQPVLGTYELTVRDSKKQQERTAKLEVRSLRVTIRRPKRVTRYLKQIGFEELTQWVVEAREINPPKGVEPLRWVLWTSLPAATLDAAWTIIGYYEQRWLIEEYHKALKTGCRIEGRQLQTAGRLEAVTGMLSILAVRLIQLKMLARSQPDTPVAQAVPRSWLRMLEALKPKARLHSVRDFIRQLAGLGGFLLRKGDGEPGWITIWRGTTKLLTALRGYEAMKNKCG